MKTGMEDSLTALYRRTQSLPCFEAGFPENVGNGRITRISTPQGVSLSEWKMRYLRETPVEGPVGKDLRLLFCLGEGVEWQSDAGIRMRLHPSHACLCAGDGSTERMSYASGAGYSFFQVSVARDRAERLLAAYLPEGTVRNLPRILNGRCFPFSGETRRLLDSLAGADRIGSGLGMLRLECRAHELMALCMEQALCADTGTGLHPDDLAAVRAVRRRIDDDAVSMPGIDALAREYAVSASKLSRDFRRVYGVSIHACIIESRLDEAARLLSSGRMTVGEVAERAGYAKHSQFSDAFRRRFGVLPKDY